MNKQATRSACVRWPPPNIAEIHSWATMRFVSWLSFSLFGCSFLTFFLGFSVSGITPSLRSCPSCTPGVSFLFHDFRHSLSLWTPTCVSLYPGCVHLMAPSHPEPISSIAVSLVVAKTYDPHCHPKAASSQCRPPVRLNSAPLDSEPVCKLKTGCHSFSLEW